MTSRQKSREGNCLLSASYAAYDSKWTRK